MKKTNNKKRMYLVRREVFANSLEEALKLKGIIYSAELADEKYQPQESKPVGFKKNE